MENNQKEGVTQEVAELLFKLQPRCINCGDTLWLEIHHRIFRSEGDIILKDWLIRMSSIYMYSYERNLPIWFSIHDIQNLCVLCKRCHTENITGVHGGNEKLRQVLRNSYTAPKTGFNIPFYKKQLHY